MLHLLAREPAYGNRLIESIEELTEGAMSVNPNTMYPLLRQMEERGLVDARWEHPDRRTRRYYSITPGGRREYRRLRAEVEPFLDSVIRSVSLIKAEIYGDSPRELIRLAEEGAGLSPTRSKPSRSYSFQGQSSASATMKVSSSRPFPRRFGSRQTTALASPCPRSSGAVYDGLHLADPIPLVEHARGARRPIRGRREPAPVPDASRRASRTNRCSTASG